MSEPTGEIATGINPRGFGEPVLRLDGRRSILALWPQDAICEVCAAGPERTGGYVGPVQGDAAIFEQCLESVDRLGEGVPSRVVDSKATK